MAGTIPVFKISSVKIYYGIAKAAAVLFHKKYLI